MTPKPGLSDDSLKKRVWIRSLQEPSSLRLLVWLVMIGISLALLWLGVSLFSEFQTFNTLKTTGYPAKARVISSRMSEGGEDTGYYITYAFTAVDDKRYVREQEVSEETYNKMGTGTSLDIVYDHNNPAVSRLSNFDEPDINRISSALALCGFPLLFLTVASLFSYFRNRHLRPVS